MSVEYFEKRKRKFYKYFSFNEYTLDSLSQNKIWLSHPENFNDPFDSTIRISDKENDKKVFMLILDFLRERCPLPLSKEEYRESDLSWIDHEGYELEKADYKVRILTDSMKLIPKGELGSFQKFIKDKNGSSIASVDAYIRNFTGLGICCFSKSFYSPTMWAHYADNHKGFCVEYDFDCDNMEHDLREVDYSNDQPKIITEKSINKESLLRHILHKSKEWSYEEEYRLISKAGTNTLIDHGGQITGLCFGLKTSHQQKEIIKRLLRGVVPESEFYNAKDNSNLYAIDWEAPFFNLKTKESFDEGEIISPFHRVLAE